MTGRRSASRHTARGLLAGALAIATVTAVIALLNQFLPLRSLTGLYLFAIVPIAIGWGFLLAAIVAVASYLTFAYFLGPPVHSFEIADSSTATALLISIIAAYVVTELARRAQAGAREARSRAQEAERAQKEHRRIADEQAALRRVATLVAADVPAIELFRAVAAEAGTLLAVDYAWLIRVEAEDSVDAVAVWSAEGEQPEVAGRWPVEREGLVATISRSARAARLESWDAVPGAFAAFARDKLRIRSSVGSPIVVDGRVWGALLVHSKRHEPLAPDTESRLSNFADLVATSIANSQSRAEVRRLANEQAALRRVAVLVARGAAPQQVFAAVTEEVGRLLGVDHASMAQYGPDRTLIDVMLWNASGEPPQRLGQRVKITGRNATTLVLETGRPVRIDSYADATGEPANVARAHGLRSSVAAPISVEGRLWGIMIAGSKREYSLPPGAEERLGQFTALVATAVANAEARGELTASRARIIAAGDEARRRIERDLHDGVQQRLVSLALRLRQAQEEVPRSLPGIQGSLAHAADALREVVAEVQEISRGIHPAILSKGGLGPALKALARHAAIPVEVSVELGARLPEQAEVAAYYVVAEAVANVVKHARATCVAVSVGMDAGALQIEVRDDGIGGAEPSGGSGLVGLADRVEALDGKLHVVSPPGAGTTLQVTLPLEHTTSTLASAAPVRS